MTNIIIRLLKDSDWLQIPALMGELRAELSQLHPVASWQETAEPYLKRMQKNLKDMNGSYFVAEDAGIILGHGYGWIIEENDYETHPDRIRYGHIEELFVKPAHRKKGIGSSLMKALIKDIGSKQTSHIRLGVLYNNVQSTKFYESCGFKTYFLTMQQQTPKS